MELFNYSLKIINLNHLCEEIFKNKNSLYEFLKMIDDNPDWIEENIVGDISASTLLRLINLSYDDKKYGLMLTSIIDVVEGKIVNDKIFEKMIYHPDDTIRETLRVSLAHKKLSEKQLILLCREETTFECFFELAALYYTSEVHDISKLERFIECFKNSKFAYMLEILLVEIVNGYEASDKMKYLFITDFLKVINIK